MTNTGASKIGLYLLDRLTDRFPVVIPRFFQRTFIGLLGSEFIFRLVWWKYQRQWRLAKIRSEYSISKILLIVDICIGDTVLWAQCMRVLQSHFPNAEIHYACNRTGGELIAAMPNVTVHNIIQGQRGMPTAVDLQELKNVIERESSSLIFNLSPFIPQKTLTYRLSRLRAFQIYVPFAAYVTRAWKRGGERHVSYLSRQFFDSFLNAAKHSGGEYIEKERTIDLNANMVYLDRESVSAAENFFADNQIVSDSGVVMFNPDATSAYGQMPFDVQSQLLRSIARMPEVSKVLIGKAYTSKGIEERLLSKIAPEWKHKFVLIPHVPLPVYTAMIDLSDMFISSDTGPLHIASCWKARSLDGSSLRNRTAVIAIYGATDSRMYGYDSSASEHTPSNQSAPSRSFTAPVPCRNISCINKFGKSCSQVRCFDRLPVDRVLMYISSYFQSTDRLRAGHESDVIPSSDLLSITIPERVYTT